MRLAILCNPSSWYGADLRRAAVARGHECMEIDFCRLVGRVGAGAKLVAAGDADLTGIDAVIVRTMPPGSLEQVVYRMDALACLESEGVAVLNPPKAIECAVDKYLTTSRLFASGLPVPETIVCENAQGSLEAFEQLGGDVVVKPLFGAEGRGIFRICDSDLALRAFRTLERIQAVLYLQRYIEHEGFDVRVLVLDGRVIGAMRRCSSSDFRTNVSRAAQVEPHELTPTEEDLALRAARATESRFAGIDLLQDRSGVRYVIEVNAVPGWRALQKVTGGDVASLVIESLERGAGAGACNNH